MVNSVDERNLIKSDLEKKARLMAFSVVVPFFHQPRLPNGKLG